MSVGYKGSICWLFVLLLSLSCTAESNLRLDKMWLGSTLDELTELNLVSRVVPSEILKGHWSSEGPDSLTRAHFFNGKAVLLQGLRLLEGDKQLASPGSRFEDLESSLESTGWSCDANWTCANDTRGNYIDVHRFRRGSERLVVPFFYGDDEPRGPRIIRTIWLRFADVRGPYGDSDSLQK